MDCNWRILILLTTMVIFSVSIACSGDEIGQLEADGEANFDVGEQSPDVDAAEPDAGEDVNEPSPAMDGAACEVDGDCLGEICLPAPDWPDGYCTTLDCSTAADCAGDGVENGCLMNPSGPNFCVRLCDPNSPGECREGYDCHALQGGDGWCAPDAGTGGTPPDDPGDVTMGDVECQAVSGQQVQLDYTIADDTEEYMIVPFTTDGGMIMPLSISGPNTTIDFQGQNDFQTLGAELFGFINPTVVPAAPQFDFQFETGSHTYTLSTTADEVCYYLIESSGNSTAIDLNIYLVGTDHIGLDADNADSHADFQAVLSTAEELFEQVGLTFGEVRYESVPPEVEQDYQIVRSQSDVGELASHSVAPGDGVDSLSANIFITRQFSFSTGSVLGLSQGIPGAAGLHGAGISGVALTGEYMGSGMHGGIDGNEFTGVVFAHDLGHFLGLFHTSHSDGPYGAETFDPLEDTPECTTLNTNPRSCPDWGNVMFPMADAANTELTDDQGYVLGVNPLTR